MSPGTKYSKRFPRGQFASRFGATPQLHFRRHLAAEPYFKPKNPRGWAHDLGAQDVFLDNFGILAREQLDGLPWERDYQFPVQCCMTRWSRAQREVVQASPWWGRHFNSKQRRADAGEPRSLLRLLPADLLRAGVPASPVQDPPDRDADWKDLWVAPDEDSLHDDWNKLVWARLFEPIQTLGARAAPVLVHRELALGAEPEPGMLGRRIETLHVLHPRNSTPDLPLRVCAIPQSSALGVVAKSQRDQGTAPSCVAHAVCSALEIALRRPGGPGSRTQFSARALHRDTGDASSGRFVRSVLDHVQVELPLREQDELALSVSSPAICDVIEVSERAWRERRRISRARGAPIVHELRRAGADQPVDIAAVKTFLAAGWVVVVSTYLTDRFHEQLGGADIWDTGLLLTPLPGDKRTRAHAWCLVGYDHVDGNPSWKYQGRFIGLNSWGQVGEGEPFGCRSPHGTGTFSMPFAFLLNLCIEAYAIRFA
mgnify:CR=1 FL=1